MRSANPPRRTVLVSFSLLPSSPLASWSNGWSILTAASGLLSILPPMLCLSQGEDETIVAPAQSAPACSMVCPIPLVGVEADALARAPCRRLRLHHDYTALAH